MFENSGSQGYQAAAPAIESTRSHLSLIRCFVRLAWGWLQSWWWRGENGTCQAAGFGLCTRKPRGRPCAVFNAHRAGLGSPHQNLDNLIESIAGTSGCEENLDVVFLRGGRWVADDGGDVETGRDAVSSLAPFFPTVGSKVGQILGIVYSCFRHAYV